MELTAIAQWLNTAFAGYDYTILQALHNLAGTAGFLRRCAGPSRCWARRALSFSRSVSH